MFNVLSTIIARQRPLMQKFREIEARNGMVIVDTPCDMQSYVGQAEIRRLAWCIQEELCEACDAAMQTNEFGFEIIQEELIDALHFLAEMIIVMGLDEEPISVPKPKREAVGFMEVMTDLGMAMNVLKNKPWKQKLKEFDAFLFMDRFGHFLVGLSQLFHAVGLTDEKLVEVYELKYQENLKRIATGV